jgi:hypothetical protein
VTAALYPCVITHARAHPIRRVFRYRSYLWLADLNDLPQVPRPLHPLARFQARDHLGGAGGSLRAGVDAYLARHGLDLAGGRVLMLGQARVFGYVFNPLTVFWCHHADGTLAAVIAEVHNTYGQRHAYLLHPDARGRAEAGKDFYVSPFLAVAGRYRLHLPEPGGQPAAERHPAPRRPDRAGRQRDRHAPHLHPAAAARLRAALPVGHRPGERAHPLAGHQARRPPPAGRSPARPARTGGCPMTTATASMPRPAPDGQAAAAPGAQPSVPAVPRGPMALARAAVARAFLGRATARLPIQV